MSCVGGGLGDAGPATTQPWGDLRGNPERRGRATRRLAGRRAGRASQPRAGEVVRQGGALKDAGNPRRRAGWWARRRNGSSACHPERRAGCGATDASGEGPAMTWPWGDIWGILSMGRLLEAANERGRRVPAAQPRDDFGRNVRVDGPLSIGRRGVITRGRGCGGRGAGRRRRVRGRASVGRGHSASWGRR